MDITTPQQTFGQLIRRYRRRAGLTQEELAERAALSPRGLVYLERGERHPQPGTVRRLADALGLSDQERSAFMSLTDQADGNGPGAAASAVTLEVRPSSALPLQPTPFIGREREVAEVVALLGREAVRLLTLTGPGGTGKTRLAVEVAAEVGDFFPDGTIFVSLAPLTDPGLVASAVATAFDVKESASQPLIETLKAFVRSKQLLLVLDNFEHLLPAASLVGELLAACPRLVVLVTSRSYLHLAAEHEYLVPPLALPGKRHRSHLAVLSRVDAVAFFLERARAVRPDFALTDENATVIVEICLRLDGLPLALELAAVRIRLFPPQALLVRLDHRLSLLTGGAKDRPSRQQTLRGAIDWSYSLLSEEEQTLFARLSVFAGGCTFEAAEAVCNPEGELDLLTGMTSLVEQSLVRQEGEDEPRFSMLETIREYAAEKLEERGEQEAIREAHAGYLLALAEEAKPFLDRWRDAGWLERLVPDRDNLRVAFRWLLEAGKSEEAARLATALKGFWGSPSHGSFIDGRQQLEAVLTQPDLSQQIRAHALLRLCYFATHQGAMDRVREAAEEALAITRETGDVGTEFEALTNLWVAATDRGEQEAAEAFRDACIQLAPQTGNQEHVATVLRMRGFLAMQTGNFEHAGQLFAEEVALRRNPEVAGNLQGALVNVGWAALQRGDLDTAEAAYMENGTIVGRHGLAYVALERGEYDDALRLFREIVPRYFRDHIRPRLADCLEGIAQIAAAQDRPALAALLVGAADALYDDLALSHERRASEQGRLDLARSAMGEEAWTTEYGRGRTLSLKDAVHVALQYTEEP